VAQAIKNGLSTVEVVDWSSLGDDPFVNEPRKMEIEIDIMLSPAENANRYFSRFKKLSRQATHVEGLLDKTASSLTQMIALQDALGNVAYGEGAEASIAAIERMQAVVERTGVLKPRPGGRALEDLAQAKAAQLRQDKLAQLEMGPKIKVRGRNNKNAPPDFMRFKSPSGFDVVAGRSSTENDRVTWGVARDWDLWFHARGIGGSHVVVLAPPRAKVTREDIVFAARIAATHSKAQQDTKVDVSYTERRHLRSPPQRVKKPGMVMITREQVVTVVPMKRDSPVDTNNKGKYS
jgi:predicted ribosome quality control (RQC) complex YloA/Tae2 family protein